MNNQYGSLALNPQSAPALNYAQAAPASGGGLMAVAEKVFVLVLILTGAAAFFLYQSGYTYAAFGVIGTPFLFGCLLEPRVGIYAYCFWQAWDSAIVLGDQKQGAWLTPGKLFAFAVLGFCLLHMLRRPLRLSGSKTILGWSLLFCIVALASSMWSYDVMRSLRLGSQMLVQIVLAVMMVSMISTDVALVKRLAFWTILGGTTAGAYIVLFGMEQHGFDRATLSDQANPVSAAAALVVSIACVPLLWGLTGNRLFKLILAAAGCLMMVGIVGTGTRAAIGGILGGFAGAAVLAGGAGRAKRIILMAVAVVLAYVVGAMAVYSSLVPDQAAVRLAEFMKLPLPNQYSHWAGKSGGTREYVWTLAMEGYRASGFMGSGVGASAYASLDAEGTYKDVHSNLLGSLVEMGPFGLLAFIALHVALYLRIPKMQTRWLQVPAWVMTLSFLSIGLVHTTYTTKLFWVPITIAAIIYEIDSRGLSGEGRPGTAPREG